MSTLKRFFQDTVIYGIAAVLPRVINFLLVRVHTDALAADKYAVNSDFYIWAALFAVLLTFGMETAFFRFYNTEKKKDAIVATTFISMLVVAVLFVVSIGVFFDFFQQFLDFENNPLRLKLFIGILALDTISMVPFAYLRVTNRPIKYAVIKLINVGVIVLVNLLFLRYIPIFLEEGVGFPAFFENAYNSTSKVNFIFIANILGSAISFILLLPYLLKFKFQFDVQLLKKILAYSWPIMVAGLAYVINENLDKFLIKRMIGAYEMGIYSACYKLAIFMNLYIMAFRLGAEPFFFNQASKKNAKNTYALIMNYFVIIGALVFIGIVGYIDILKHFINSNYWGALAIVPIVLLANLFLGIYYNLAIWYKLTDKTRYGMYFSIIGAVITIVLNVWLIPVTGIMAAAYATLIAYASMTVVSYIIGKKHYPINYNLQKIAIYLIASVVICWVSFNYFRGNFWVSTLLITGFSAIIYFKEKKDLLAIFNKK
ncbi:Membrane protein involved in the export of O-antigen and teichoic acid [Lutibacter agarilyticus]|uniref:Membrane protein involved in the export of O-antigen and teichoic acid n=1 Tax=Lutibacter agarilyticus TaxID=1109740 RepID=A0A238W2N6_9FLAO|nr:polysaccharide biosynthesis C-terminal domain-containing protein [Lutibacter agarilyticus]SNR40768.1 Membrane protein involved in the export of O-antigen and teichoic acid [Lutibacter agarilyticus]